MKHEEKNCPRCHAAFECKAGTISLCQCITVKLSDEERHYLRQKFTDCLCGECMIALRSEFHTGLLRDKLDHLLRK